MRQHTFVFSFLLSWIYFNCWRARGRDWKEAGLLRKLRGGWVLCRTLFTLSFVGSWTHSCDERLTFAFAEVFERIADVNSHTFELVHSIACLNRENVLFKNTIYCNDLVFFNTSPPLIGSAMPCSFAPNPAPPHPILRSSWWPLLLSSSFWVWPFVNATEALIKREV